MPHYRFTYEPSEWAKVVETAKALSAAHEARKKEILRQAHKDKGAAIHAQALDKFKNKRSSEVRWSALKGGLAGGAMGGAGGALVGHLTGHRAGSIGGGAYGVGAGAVLGAAYAAARRMRKQSEQHHIYNKKKGEYEPVTKESFSAPRSRLFESGVRLGRSLVENDVNTERRNKFMKRGAALGATTGTLSSMGAEGFRSLFREYYGHPSPKQFVLGHAANIGGQALLGAGAGYAAHRLTKESALVREALQDTDDDPMTARKKKFMKRGAIGNAALGGLGIATTEHLHRRGAAMMKGMTALHPEMKSAYRALPSGKMRAAGYAAATGINALTGAGIGWAAHHLTKPKQDPLKKESAGRIASTNLSESVRLRRIVQINRTR